MKVRAHLEFKSPSVDVNIPAMYCTRERFMPYLKSVVLDKLGYSTLSSCVKVKFEVNNADHK